MKQFNVIVEDVNSRKFISYDVIPYLIHCYKETRKKKNLKHLKNLRN